MDGSPAWPAWPWSCRRATTSSATRASSRCDALVVATAGSSVYGYAAGGPVASPSVSGIVVTPSVPTSGISRPLVLSETDTVRLELTPRCGALALEADGIGHGEVGPDDRVEIAVQTAAGRVVRLYPDVRAPRSRVEPSLVDLPLLPEQLRELLPGELRTRLEARGGSA
ncbi:hypothetical protein ACL02T_20400 [Pseudonocardia sp. RS010]|uniref:hypothetical protein n=1 Tax=Pseudonocardia sp. RS010 TaxID=3385979 RepID=UPI00399F5030